MVVHFIYSVGGGEIWHDAIVPLYNSLFNSLHLVLPLCVFFLEDFWLTRFQGRTRKTDRKKDGLTEMQIDKRERERERERPGRTREEREKHRPLRRMDCSEIWAETNKGWVWVKRILQEVFRKELECQLACGANRYSRQPAILRRLIASQQVKGFFYAKALFIHPFKIIKASLQFVLCVKR